MMRDEAVRQLGELNARFIHNFVTNDVQSHDEILHRDFVCINSAGARQNRVDYLARWATGFDPDVFVYWDYRDEDIALFDAVALVRSTNKYVYVEDGVETVGMATYTDTYLLDGASWKCVQAQITAVSPMNYPGDETIVRKYVRGVLQ